MFTRTVYGILNEFAKVVLSYSKNLLTAAVLFRFRDYLVAQWPNIQNCIINLVGDHRAPIIAAFQGFTEEENREALIANIVDILNWVREVFTLFINIAAEVPGLIQKNLQFEIKKYYCQIYALFGQEIGNVEKEA